MIKSYIYAIVFNLGILIFVHELGHYFAARAAGITVERFSMGFGPRIIKFTRGVTEYALSIIPFGGYVKMAGMEAPEEGGEPGSDTFLGKRIGVRAMVVAAGPAANLVWAYFVIVGVLIAFGLPTLGEPVVGEVEPDSPAEVAGLVLGDRIVSVEGEAVEDWEDVVLLAADDEDGIIDLVVERDSGETVRSVELTLEIGRDDETDSLDLGLTAYVPPVIGDVMSGGPADRAGLLAGDRVVSVDGGAVRTWYELGDIIRESPGVELSVVWERDGEVMQALITPEEGEEPVGTTDVRTVGLVGIMQTWENRKLAPAEAATTALRFTAANLRMIVEFFVGLVTGQVSGSLVGGPIRVVQMASESARWGASFFFGFMAYMSINLFLINMLPLPILDGGHLLLMALEKVRGRGLTDRQLMVWQQVGLIFFVSLMVFLLVRDAFSFG